MYYKNSQDRNSLNFSGFGNLHKSALSFWKLVGDSDRFLMKLAMYFLIDFSDVFLVSYFDLLFSNIFTKNHVSRFYNCCVCNFKFQMTSANKLKVEKRNIFWAMEPKLKYLLRLSHL